MAHLWEKSSASHEKEYKKAEGCAFCDIPGNIPKVLKILLGLQNMKELGTEMSSVDSNSIIH